MSLKENIYKAFVNSMGGESELDETQSTIIDGLSKDLRDAFVDFLTKQTFRITEMEAVLEVESIKTNGSLKADVLPKVSVASNIAPGTVSVGAGAAAIPAPAPIPVTGNIASGKDGVLIPKLNLAKKALPGHLPPQGGSMEAIGHAYIGNNPVDQTQTNERKTKVQLLKSDLTEL